MQTPIKCWGARQPRLVCPDSHQSQTHTEQVGLFQKQQLCFLSYLCSQIRNAAQVSGGEKVSTVQERSESEPSTEAIISLVLYPLLLLLPFDVISLRLLLHLLNFCWEFPCFAPNENQDLEKKNLKLAVLIWNKNCMNQHSPHHPMPTYSTYTHPHLPGR